jgi:4-amino-4-deoxy-L-arabinose transferase-like glycosyltransferase
VFGVVLAVFVALSLAVALLTPPWEAADEPGHARNAIMLARGDMYRMEPGAGNEPHQPPLYYLVLAGWHRALSLDLSLPHPVNRSGAFFNIKLGRYDHDTPRSDLEARRVRLLRLPNIAMGLAAVVLTYFCARRLSDDPWTPVVAAAVVATLPRFVFVAGVVNNDNLAIALGAGLTCLTVATVVAPPQGTRRRLLAGAIGAVVGGLLLTKLSAVALAGGAVLALILVGRRRDAPVLLGWFAGGALAVSAAWLAYNQIVYGDPLALDAAERYLWTRALFRRDFSAFDLIFDLVPHRLYTSFVYTSGWNQYFWPDSWYLPFWLLLGGAVAGLARRRHRLADDQERHVRRRNALVVLGVLAVGAIAALWVVALGNHALPDTIQGRLALPGLAAIGCLAAVGLERLRVPVVLRFALPLLGILGSVYAIYHDVWQPFHA